jgi:hypothetical protein
MSSSETKQPTSKPEPSEQSALKPENAKHARTAGEEGTAAFSIATIRMSVGKPKQHRPTNDGLSNKAGTPSLVGKQLFVDHHFAGEAGSPSFGEIINERPVCGSCSKEKVRNRLEHVNRLATLPDPKEHQRHKDQVKK